jgi:hypothetical protein
LARSETSGKARVNPGAIIFVVVLTILLVVGVVISHRNRVTLENLPELPGEKTVFEETGLRVEQSGPELVSLPACRVRVTNKRLLIAIKSGETHVLRHALVFAADPRPGVEVVETLGERYVAAEIKRELPTMTTEDGEVVVEVVVPGSDEPGLNVLIFTKDPKAYQALPE